MERIAAILIVFVLLMNGRHVEHRRPGPPTMIAIMASPVPLDADAPARRMLGPLRYLGGWSLTSRHPGFGGFSSMLAQSGGRLLMVNDTGESVFFRPRTGTVRGRFGSLPVLPRERGEPRWRWDTESTTADPASGRIWIGIELTRRVCRYAARLRRVERCADPVAMADWPETTGVESMQRLPDGRFLLLAEDAPVADGGTDVLLYPGDPVERPASRPIHLSYHAPTGYLPTDALWLGAGRMLVMNRRVTPYAGFTGILTLVDVRDLRPGAVLEGIAVARFERPVLHDNFEALALSWEGGRPVLLIASDDNHMIFQRSLLLRFALPPEWVTDRSRAGPRSRPGPPDT